MCWFEWYHKVSKQYCKHSNQFKSSHYYLVGIITGFKYWEDQNISPLIYLYEHLILLQVMFYNYPQYCIFSCYLQYSVPWSFLSAPIFLPTIFYKTSQLSLIYFHAVLSLPVLRVLTAKWIDWSILHFSTWGTLE